MLCRQGSESMEAQMQLQAEVDRWQQESNELSTALREAQAGREQAEVHLERLQGSLQDLQRHNQGGQHMFCALHCPPADSFLFSPTR